MRLKLFVGLLGLVVLAAPVLGVTVRLGNATVGCAVPVTLPVSISAQSGDLRDLTWKVTYDPEKVMLLDFEIEPMGVLPTYIPKTRVIEPGSVEIRLDAAGTFSSANGTFGSINFALTNTEPGPVQIAISDVVSSTGLQGPVGGEGVAGVVTTTCTTDRRGRAEVYRYARLAGSSGGGGFADGTGSGARFIAPAGIVVSGGELFVTDSGAHTIRRVSVDGAVTTWAGAPGVPGRNDGVRTGARFDTPEGILAMPDGSLLVADRGNAVIRRISADGTVTTWAGTGIPGFRDGGRLTSQFGAPSALALEASGGVLVADSGTCTVRRIIADKVTLLAGSPFDCGVKNGPALNATFDGMSGILSHPTLGIIVADEKNHVLRRIVAENSVLTYAGAVGVSGTSDGLIAVARFRNPRGLAMQSDGSILVAAANGVRRIVGNNVQTLAGGANTGWIDGVGSSARFSSVGSVAIKDGQLFVSELGNTTIRAVSETFEVTTIAGSANLSGFRDDAGPSARFNTPWQVSADSAGNLFVADRANHCIRRVTPDGNVTVWAGRPGVPGGADGQRLEATFQNPVGCAVDSSGNVWVSEPAAHVVRLIRTTGEVVTIAGERGVPGFVSSFIKSQFNTPMQLAAGPNGGVYVADMGNNAIRHVNEAGRVTTVAGNGTAGAEDGLASSARFDSPTGVATTQSGRVIVADRGNNAIREINEGRVRTLNASSILSGNIDGGPPDAGLDAPEGVAVLPDGSVLVAESGGRIRRVVENRISTLAGRSGLSGNQTGLGIDALFGAPVSVAAVGDRAFVVSDSENDGLVRATLCADDSLCILGSRFALSLRATDPRTSAQAEGVPLAENDLFGFFSLPGLTGNESNPEVFVKVLDGVGVNGKYWVFYGGLTDFAYELEAYDRVSDTTVIYDKPGLEFCGGADTGAFSGSATAGITLDRVASDDATPIAASENADCSDTELCLRSGRFKAELVARDPRTDAVAAGVPIPRTGDFGYFSLPGLTGNASNPEVFVKVLDGTGVNGRYWVFYGGLTDFEFTLDVTDAESGMTRTYVKPGLEFCGGADTNAF